MAAVLVGMVAWEFSEDFRDIVFTAILIPLTLTLFDIIIGLADNYLVSKDLSP